MKVLVVRASRASVSVRAKVVSSIDRGIVVFAGIENNDEASTLEEAAQKIVNLRIFENEQGKLDHSVKDNNYQILCISNFTLCADTNKGRRPSFERSMPKQQAGKLFDDFLLLLRARGIEVKAGVFAEHMDIDVRMDGPVNIIFDSNQK